MNVYAEADTACDPSTAAAAADAVAAAGLDFPPRLRWYVAETAAEAAYRVRWGHADWPHLTLDRPSDGHLDVDLFDLWLSADLDPTTATALTETLLTEGTLMARKPAQTKQLTAALTKHAPHPDGRIQRLRESSGHAGPWTSAEYTAAISTDYVEAGKFFDDVPEPDDLAVLREAYELDLAAFEQAYNAVVAASHEARKHREKPNVYISALTGQAQAYKGAEAQATAAIAELKAKEQDRNVAEAKLDVSRGRYQDAHRAWRQSLWTAEYERTAQQ